MTTTNSKDFSPASSIVGQKRRFFRLIGGAAILLFLRQLWAAAAFLGAALLVVGGVAIFGDPDWVKLPVDFSFVLVTVVTLLSIEWLTRKLLKLA